MKWYDNKAICAEVAWRLCTLGQYQVYGCPSYHSEKFSALYKDGVCSIEILGYDDALISSSAGHTRVRHTVSRIHDVVVDVPPTDGVKYAGSKLKLLPYILSLARRVKARTVLDGFSGTTRVSQALAKSGYRVLCNDIAVWSEVFGLCYLC